MEIKVGEYVRTKSGDIGIFNKYFKDKAWFEMKKNDDDFCGIQVSTIVKHSFNIIDLIEVGDIVEAVTDEDFEGEYTEKLEVAAIGITDGKGNKLNEIGICGDDGIEYVSLKDIRTILTHEQYERNCYRLEEE